MTLRPFFILILLSMFTLPALKAQEVEVQEAEISSDDKVILPEAILTPPNDTIIQANKAKSLRIYSNDNTVNITVKRIDETAQNFYYDTTAGSGIDVDFSNQTVFKDITDLTITEVDGQKLIIDFQGSHSNPNALTFEIPDPQNRTVKSYYGLGRRDFGINLTKRGKSDWCLISSGLSLGFIHTLGAPQNMDASMGRSLEWSWLNILGVKWVYGPNSVSLGFGLLGRNYTMKNGYYYDKQSDGTIALLPFSEGMTKGRSSLWTFSIQLPLLYKIQFGKSRDFALSVGPVLNFNTGAHLHTGYTFDSKDYSINTGHIHQSPVTVDALGVLSWQAIGIYARYSPMSVLRRSAALDFNAVSVGLMLFY